jgi:hypothetical protein
MATIRPGFAFHVGDRVQHGSDPAKALGFIIAVHFGSTMQAVVRWQDTATSIEPLDNLTPLVDVASAAAVEVLERIRRSLDRGAVPVACPATTVVGYARGQRCDACGTAIESARPAYEVRYLDPPRLLHFHQRCHDLWEAECRHRGHRQTS